MAYLVAWVGVHTLQAGTLGKALLLHMLLGIHLELKRKKNIKC